MVIEGIRQFGQSHGLEPLDWQITVVDGAPFVDGAPLEGQDQHVCQQWVDALALREYEFDAGDGVRSWYSTAGAWDVEISTLPHC